MAPATSLSRPRIPGAVHHRVPWTVGGYVATETFDHSSLIRFLETRFGVAEPNISAWRRATVGDLTSAFQFSHRAPFPASNEALSVPATTVTLVTAQKEIANNPGVTVPAVNTPPVQETTSRTGYLRPSPSAPSVAPSVSPSPSPSAS
jgi:phospholipase C